MSLLSPSVDDKGLLRPSRIDEIKQRDTDNDTQLLLLGIALVFFLINIPRCFNGDFWNDETCTIWISKQSFEDIIQNSWNGDMHPPLYYLFVSGFCNIFGFNAFTYHMSTLVMYAAILLICATVVYKQFGRNASIVMMILSTLLSSSLLYNMEVRVYELALLLTLIAFLSFYYIVRYDRKIDWMIFVITTILAVWTYYYAILTIGMLFIILILLSLKNKEQMKKMIIICVIAGIGILACSGLILKVLGNTSDFWIERPENLVEMVEYLFHSNASVILVPTMIFLMICFFYRLPRNNDEKTDILTKFRRSDANTKMMVAGLFAIFGTYFVILVISLIYRPMSIPRHLYHMSAIAWVMFAVLLTHLTYSKWKKVLAVSLTAAMVIMVCNSGYAVYVENENWESTQNILDKTSEIDENHVIISNVNHMCGYKGAEIPYYYPKAQMYYTPDLKIPHLDENLQYWLFLIEKVDNNTLIQLFKQGYTVQLIAEGMFASDYYSYVYKIIEF